MREFNLVSKGFIERMEKNKKVIEALRGRLICDLPEDKADTSKLEEAAIRGD